MKPKGWTSDDVLALDLFYAVIVTGWMLKCTLYSVYCNVGVSSSSGDRHTGSVKARYNILLAPRFFFTTFYCVAVLTISWYTPTGFLIPRFPPCSQPTCCRSCTPNCTTACRAPSTRKWCGTAPGAIARTARRRRGSSARTTSPSPTRSRDGPRDALWRTCNTPGNSRPAVWGAAVKGGDGAGRAGLRWDERLSGEGCGTSNWHDADGTGDTSDCHETHPPRSENGLRLAVELLVPGVAASGENIILCSSRSVVEAKLDIVLKPFLDVRRKLLKAKEILVYWEPSATGLFRTEQQSCSCSFFN